MVLTSEEKELLYFQQWIGIFKFCFVWSFWFVFNSLPILLFRNLNLSVAASIM